MNTYTKTSQKRWQDNEKENSQREISLVNPIVNLLQTKFNKVGLPASRPAAMMQTQNLTADIACPNPLGQSKQSCTPQSGMNMPAIRKDTVQIPSLRHPSPRTSSPDSTLNQLSLLSDPANPKQSSPRANYRAKTP